VLLDDRFGPSYANRADLAAAQIVATSNSGCLNPVLNPANVQFGYWDRDTATFTSPAPFGQSVNAVRLRLERTQAAGNPLSLFFAHLIQNANADAAASATAMYDRWLCGPFVGIDGLSVPGNPLTDSFNSEEALYNPWTARERGSICSDGPVRVDGSPLIRGDARAGKGYSVSITGNGTVTGTVGSRLKPLNLRPVDASEAAAVNDNKQISKVPEGKSWKSAVDGAGNFLLDGTKTMDLPPGTYYLKNFTLTGQRTLNISGPTTIYLTGNLERAGGATVNNNTAKAANLKFLMTGGTANVTSNNDFYGVVYGTDTDVTIDGDSDLYGAIVGKTLTITGSGAGHYDESLNMAEIEFPERTMLVD